jgi:hypothetical protein
MTELFQGEREWIKEHRPHHGLIEAKREARQLFAECAVREAKTVEDLKPVLLYLLGLEA